MTCYFTRTNSKDQYLISGYANVAMAKRVKGMEKNSTGGKFWEGEMFYDLDTGKFGAAESGVKMRGYVKAPNSSQGGRFAVFSLLNGKPNDLGLRFAEFGQANTFMKAVASAYGELWLLEMEVTGTGSGSDEEDEDFIMSDAAPF
jgi:hypothetical protein